MPGFLMGVSLSVTFIIVDPWQYCVCFIRFRCNPVHPLNGALPGPYVQARVTRGALVAHRYTFMHDLAAEPCSRAGLLFPSRCPSGTILLAPYSMVWDWQVSRAGPMLLYWSKLVNPYCSLLLFFGFSSFCL